MKTPRLIQFALMSMLICSLAGAQPAPPADDSSTANQDELLSPNPDFQVVASKLDLGGTSFHYTDTENAFEWLVDRTKPLRSISPQAGGVIQIVEQGLRKLGFDQINDFGNSTAKLRTGTFRSKTYLHLKERTGLFSLAGPEPGEIAALKYVPADAAAVWCGNLEFSMVIPLARDAARAGFGPPGQGMLNGFLSDIGKEGGLDIPKTLGALGNEWCCHALVSSTGGDAADTTSSVRFLARVAVTSGDFLEGVKSALRKNLTFSQVEPVGNLTVWRLEPQETTGSLELYVAAGENWVVVTNDTEELRRSEETARGENNLLNSPEFQKQAVGLPEKINALTYLSRRYLDHSAGSIFLALDQAEASVGGADEQVVKALVKAARNFITKSSVMTPQVSWRVNDPKGILWVQLGGYPTSPATLTAAAGAGLVASISIPAFLRARENSRGHACQENLSKMDGAKAQFALDHKVKNGVEVRMDQLVGTYLRSEPKCPSGGNYTLGKIGESPTCSVGAETGAFIPHVLPE